jgi:RNA polymerase sigma-70 factor (ECF subfamily)
MTLSLTICRLPAMSDGLRRGDVPTFRASETAVGAESSFALVQRARTGDVAAQNELCARYIPRLQRWAHGRLPAFARGSLDTHDLVQDTFVQVLKRIGEFEPRHEGAFLAYLRQTLLNRVRDEIRRAHRREPAAPLDPGLPAPGPSPLAQAIGQEVVDRYEAALARLKPGDREAVVLRIELGYSYAEVAAALEKPSAAAAQMAVSRALVRLGEEMTREPA